MEKLAATFTYRKQSKNSYSRKTDSFSNDSPEFDLYTVQNRCLAQIIEQLKILKLVIFFNLCHSIIFTLSLEKYSKNITVIGGSDNE